MYLKSESCSQIPRIALVTGNVALGGATTFLINFGGEVVRRGGAVEIFSMEEENPYAADLQSQRVPVFCANERRMIFEHRLGLILRQLARFQPTVVIATLGAVSFEVLRYLPTGVVRVGLGQSDDPQVYEMMSRYAAIMDLTGMVSQTMLSKAKAMPEFAHTSVAYLPYGVPMCRDAELPQKPPMAPIRILYLGRLAQEQKRVRLFPEIFKQLVRSKIPFHWTIAGEGKERGYLEANLKAASRHQTVSFAGPVSYSRVPEILKQHDIYLLTSTYEGLPLSLLEAMGHGLVPVVSDLASGIGDIVDATNGALVPVEQTSGYAQAILRLHCHRDELVAKSAAARARVEKEFSVAAMTDRWLSLLPPPKEAIAPWPQHWHIHAPLTAQNKFYFSPPMRLLRRMALLCRHRLAKD